MAILQVQAPAVPAVSLDALKAHLRITSSAEDDFLQGILAVAVEEVETRAGLALVSQEIRQVCPYLASREIRIERGPLLEVVRLAVKRAEGEPLEVDPATIETVEANSGEILILPEAVGGASTRDDAVEVFYRAGYGAGPENVPPTLRHAVQLIAAHRYEVREDVVIGTIVSPVPNSAKALIALHQRRWVT